MVGRTLLQAFHWYYPGDGRLWTELTEKAGDLAAMGITDVWLPPACKGASGTHSVGYDAYDLFDLGEFDQKGSVATKYGTREELTRATEALRDCGVGVLHDVVFDHKTGADETERVMVQRVQDDNRTEKDGDPFEATVHSKYTFPGRGGQYSQFIWDHKCFNGIDYLEEPQEDGVFILLNEYDEGEWNSEVDQEMGNFEYLMGASIEFRNHAVYEELKYWGRWMAEQLPCNGFRLDATKHIPAWFFRDWVGHMRESLGQELFVVAEYWNGDLGALEAYIDLTDRQISLFDAPIHFRFHDAARAGGDFDMRTIFEGTLLAAQPDLAVTLVDNHDTQPLQCLEAPVEPWFKPMAYGLILMNEHGVPCIFYPDLYGAHYTDKGTDGGDYEIELSPVDCLPRLIEARQRFANGPQTEIFDDPNCIALVRHGTAEAPGAVLILTNGGDAEKSITLGEAHSGAGFRDFLGHREEEVFADDQGQASFPVNGGSVSLWVRSDLF